MTQKKTNRLDLILVERGIVPTREKAQALILSGQVLVEDRPTTKPGHSVLKNAEIRIRGEIDPYVSRGAHKLIAALDAFQVSVHDKTALDLGASTGGFTQVLLERGATQVYALDVGHNQLDWKIRSDPRVRVFEKINARLLKSDDLGRSFDLIVVDVSFISLELIFPAILLFLTKDADCITLIKPQFEVGRADVGKGGIVTSNDAKKAAIERLTLKAESLGLVRKGLIESPILGTEGNQEFLAHWKK